MVVRDFLNAASFALLIWTLPALVRTPTTCSGFLPFLAFFRFFAAIGESSSGVGSVARHAWHFTRGRARRWDATVTARPCQARSGVSAPGGNSAISSAF